MRSVLFTILILITLIRTTVYGQGKEMFIEQIAGKKIVRENFDKNGDLQGKQIFLIGKLIQDAGIYKVDVVTELYNKSGELDEKYSTTYKCSPKDFDVLLNVFPFTDPNDKKIKVDVTSKDFKQLYEIGNDEDLKDIHLKMRVESGLLSFFGSKSLITIKDRERKLVNTSIIINSKVVIVAYMMGIKIKTIKYRIEEYLTGNFILQHQKFTEDDGAYFTMEYEDKY